MSGNRHEEPTEGKEYAVVLFGKEQCEMVQGKRESGADENEQHASFLLIGACKLCAVP